jgi:FlaA1/EpsC-like NDP-sugar epimerase
MAAKGRRYASMGEKILLLISDSVVVVTGLIFAFAVRFNPDQLLQEITHFSYGALWLCTFLILALSLTGLYRPVLRHAGTEMIGQVLKGTLLGIGAFAVFDLFDEKALVPRSVLIASGTFAFLGLLSYRLMIRWVLRIHLLEDRRNSKQNVVIYGAGLAGLQLLASLRQNRTYQVIAFVDDDMNLQGRQIRGISVYSPSTLLKLRQNQDLQLVFLAMPTESHSRRRQILEMLRPLQVGVQVLPTLDQLIQVQAVASSLQEVSVDDLLGRDEIPADPKLIDQELRGKSVMVSGAGGSIGSELCREILKHKPFRLILFEISEFSLYRLHHELHEADGTQLIPILGNVLDRVKVESVLKEHGIQTIFHAAAYKHVPLVEANPEEGLSNNVMGTKTIVEACMHFNVQTFVLISTDKAVRPTNVMGASKRIAELIVQDAARRSPGIRWSMVRFGNVLDSSGSVVPLFREQIRKRIAVTVTHPEITRYFMSIGEAARLVIQAGAMAEGGEVFLLDMGSAVKIRELAVQMIELSGFVPDRDIPIRFTDLRPGEKLY